jgi:exosortase K
VAPSVSPPLRGGDVKTRICMTPWMTPLLRRENWIYALGLLIAVGLKAHYSAATADGLSWILAPTAALVGWLRCEPLSFESGLGWVPPDHRFVIAPVCAGVNFMILVFSVSVVGFAHRRRASVARRCAWLAALLCCAYVLTIAVNALRIVVAVWLYDGDVHAGWFTTERVHRLAGTVIYLSALSAAWLALEHVMEGRALRDRAAQRGPFTDGVAALRPPFGTMRSNWFLLPLAYLAMTVMLPLLNGAWRQFGGRFVEHALTVTVLALAAGLLLSTIRSVTSSATGSATKGGADEQGDDLGGRRRAGNR